MPKGMVAAAREQRLETAQQQAPPALAVAVVSKQVRVHETDWL